MAKTIKEERLRWVKPIAEKQVKLINVAKVCPHSKRSLERWLSDYKKYGEKGLEPKSTRPKTNPKETPIRIKERIIELRKEKDLCAKKLHWYLFEEGIDVHTRTIGKILKQEGLVRKYRSRKQNYKRPKKEILKGELIEIDVKHVPNKIDGRKYYQYTAIDCASRWRYIEIFECESNYNAICFLKEVIRRFSYVIKAVKTDNHSTFTNRYTGYQKSRDPQNPRLHAFDLFCNSKGMIHYLIDPGKPAQNGKVERSHRSDQESFYDKIPYESIEELKYQIRLWNMYYNDLKHCSLNGLSPNQALSLRVQNVCT